jgi:hypothetical protein
MRLTSEQVQATHRTLFAQPIDIAWVEQLSTRDDLRRKNAMD